MPEAESAQETTTEELPVPVPEIEDEAETEQEYVPPTQTDSIPVQPTQPEPKSAPEPKANDNELADMVYVPGFGWIESQDPTKSSTPRICTRTAIKSASWADLKNCAA